MKRFLIIAILLLLICCVFALCACEGILSFGSDGTEEEGELPEEQQPEGPSSPEDPGESETPEQPEVPENPFEEEEPEEVYYQITFMGLDGEVIGSVSVKEGEKIELVQPKEYDGYVFVEWNLPSDIAVRDTVVEAIYAQLHSVQVNVTSGEEVLASEEFECVHGSLLSDIVDLELVGDLLPEGYEIVGDYADSVFYDRLVEDDVVLDIECALKKFDLILNGITPQSQAAKVEEIIYGETLELETLLAEGYLFKGWYSDAECTQAYSPQPIAGDVELYAKWEEITSQTRLELADDEDIALLLANPHAQFTVTAQIDFQKIADAKIVFDGIFDGGADRGIIAEITSPLFLKNNGEIRNLNAEINGGSPSEVQMDQKYTAFGAICAGNAGRITNCTISGEIAVSEEVNAVGGVCGVNLGEISDINADISIAYTAGTRAYIGGICGKAGGVGISDIAGDISVTGGVNGIGGGICGQMIAAGTITDISISADISQALLAGGAVGEMTFGTLTLEGEIYLNISLSESAMYSGNIIAVGNPADTTNAQLSITQIDGAE